MNALRVVLIGTGNVAYHLGKQIQECQAGLRQLYGRNREKTQVLAALLGVQGVAEWQELLGDADLYILAVSDQAIQEVAKDMATYIPPGALVVHCSGATPGSILSPFFSRYGVLYPLQTFSKGRESHFQDVPLCIDANTEEDRQKLMTWGQKLCNYVFWIKDEDREVLHVGAVFANNFVHHLYTIAFEILETRNLPRELLGPLIRETAEKALAFPVESMQTGPAIRKDTLTMQRHLAFLEIFPDYRKIYEILSERIQHKHH